MQKLHLTVNNASGLHARPAKVFVSETQKFTSDITVACNGKTTNAKSVLGDMSLGAVKGTPLEIDIQGEDEQEAKDAILTLFAHNLYES